MSSIWGDDIGPEITAKESFYEDDRYFEIIVKIEDALKELDRIEGIDLDHIKDMLEEVHLI